MCLDHALPVTGAGQVCLSRFFAELHRDLEICVRIEHPCLAVDHNLNNTEIERRRGTARWVTTKLLQYMDYILKDIYHMNEYQVTRAPISTVMFDGMTRSQLWGVNLYISARITEIQRLYERVNPRIPLPDIWRQTPLLQLLDNYELLAVFFRWVNDTWKPKSIFMTSVAKEDLEQENRKCIICQENYHLGDFNERPVKLRCGHVFGEKCIQQWVRGKGVRPRSTCPLCRAQLPVRLTIPPLILVSYWQGELDTRN